MEPIYDRAGEPIAWRHRDAIFNNRGKPLALVRARVVYAPDGRFLGRFGDGFYRDASGYAVAFEEGATGGPLPPLVHPTGAQPRWEELPREPQLATPPAPPRMLLRAWSPHSWEDYISGAAAPVGS